MSFIPAKLTPTPSHIKGDDFEYSFQFKESDQPLDLSAFDKIDVTLFGRGITVFSHSTSANTVTISSSEGSNNDIISGSVGSSDMDVGIGTYFIEVTTYLNGAKKTYVSSYFDIVRNARSGSSNEWVINISNSSDSATGERATNILTLAVAAKNEAQGYAANLNRTGISSGDAGKIERVKSDESGWETVTASEAGIATESYTDDRSSLSSVSVNMFDADKTGATDSRSAFVSAINYAKQNDIGKVTAVKGTYRINDTIDIDKSDLVIDLNGSEIHSYAKASNNERGEGEPVGGLLTPPC